MPGPFYDAIKGSTAGTPGTGAFTPNAASPMCRAWSTVPTGWYGLVRFEDGSAWELSWCYWNGTTLSRGTNQRFDSSTGSVLSLTSVATAAMVIGAAEVMSHLGGVPWRGGIPFANGANHSAFGFNTVTQTGTAAANALATTNYLTEQPRVQLTSATTANAQCGISAPQAASVYSSTAGRGGFEIVGRFGFTQLPTGPRLFAGLASATFVANTGEPSAFTAHVAAFAKDSTDTNIQLLVNSNAGSGTKIDTGIPLTANGWYEFVLWAEPGGGRIHGLLVRMDTGDIWYGSTTTDIPTTTTLIAMMLGGLSGTTGTAAIMQSGGFMIRGAG